MIQLTGASLKLEVTIQDLAAFGEAIAKKAVVDLKTMLAEKAERDKQAEECPWLSAAQVCKKLGIGKSTLYNYRNLGMITAHKIGGQIRFDPADVMRLLGQSGLPEAAVAHPDVMA